MLPLSALKHLLPDDTAKSSTACVSGLQSYLDTQKSFCGLEMAHIALSYLNDLRAATDMSKSCQSLK